MKTAGVLGLGSACGSSRLVAQVPGEPARMPYRTFGRSGVKVPILALGGIFDITMNQLVLQRALDLGVTYWDTAHVYTNGKSETGVGMYFEKYPETRKKIFLVTKATGPHSPENLDRMLEESFQRMKTDYIDLFFLHGLENAEPLSTEVKAWVEKAKAANKIRLFGFSAHGNMEKTLLAASKVGWLDGIMLKYDYRLMQTDEMRVAVDACQKAGIGLTAMKTQGGGPIRVEDEADLKLGGHFLKRGFTEHQAKLKAVWENPAIASICSQMSNVTVLNANAAAAMDKTKLAQADLRVLREHAASTPGRYCAGCAELCEGALGNGIPVGDLMRCLMYQRHYGDSELARATFAQVPAFARERLAAQDFTPAESACPQKLPIGVLMREASHLFC